MSKYRSRILIMALILMAFTVSTVQATWEVEQIESGPDDGFITETGNKYFDTPWVQVKSTTTSLTSYFAFRGVDIPPNATILNATLQFTAPGPVTFAPNATLDVTIYGLKTGDLTSWDPTPDLESEPPTISLTNWDATPLSNNAVINVTVTGQVIEIYEQYSWTSGNDMGFRILSVLDPSILAARYQVAYDADPTEAMKLYIEYTESNATTIYYKGYTITSKTVGTGAVLTYTNTDEWESRLITVNDTDIKDVVTFSGFSSSIAPDSAVSVGSDVYMVFVNENSPYNNSLHKSTDRGATWQKVGDLVAGGTVSSGRVYALVYDEVDTIWVAYASGFSTDGRAFTISNQSMSSQFVLHSGGFSVGEHRGLWDSEHDTVWFTRFGGTTVSSLRRPTVIRRPNGGPWENFTLDAGDNRGSDIIWADSNMYWGIHDYSATPATNVLRLYELGNYSDLTNWTNVGNTVGGLTDFVDPSFDLGVYDNEPVISMRVKVGSHRYIYQNRWSGIGWNTNIFNITPSQIFQTPYTFSFPKMYYQGDGNLMMALIAEGIDSGSFRVLYNDYNYFLAIQDWPGVTTIANSASDAISGLGGDSYPYTAGHTVFSVYDENGTLIGEFDTLEDAEVAIDDIPGVGQTPDDPNPPGSSYPDDGFGVLSRFNVRFVIWGVGWFLIIVPVIIMAVKPWPLKIYLIFTVCIALGFALQWTIGSI